MRQRAPRLFDTPLRPRQAPRKLMHVVDAGEASGLQVCRFECHRCGYESDWLVVKGVTEAKRGLPCPKCNAGRD